MLKKYGGVPPVQVSRRGWQTTALAGVLIMKVWARAPAAKTREKRVAFIVAASDEGEVGVW